MTVLQVLVSLVMHLILWDRNHEYSYWV